MWFWVVLGAVIVAIGFVAFTGAPYVPSKRSDLKKAFTKLYKLSPGDVLVDIGSGDGVVLREASRLGARVVGYEIHPILVVVSKWLSRHDSRVSVKLANFWKTQLPDSVTIVYVFGEDRDIHKMFEYVQQESNRLEREIMLMSYAFEVNGAKLVKSLGAHHLYQVTPLQ